MSKAMDTLTKDVKAKRKLPPIVHLSYEGSKALCGARLEGVLHERGEENCVVCIEMEKARTKP